MWVDQGDGQAVDQFVQVPDCEGWVVAEIGQFKGCPVFCDHSCNIRDHKMPQRGKNLEKTGQKRVWHRDTP